MNEQSLKGNFLVSMPILKGDYFQNSLILLIDHNAEGAFGLVVNNLLDLRLSDLLSELQAVNFDIPVVEGGPVDQQQLFFLHSAEQRYENSIDIGNQVLMSTSGDLIADIASGASPEKLLAVVGYSGWSQNQLAQEIQANAWLVTPFNPELLFSLDFRHKPQAAADLLGIDLHLINPSPGHG